MSWSDRAQPRLAILLLSLALAAIAGGCTQWADPRLPQTTVFPASDYGEMIQNLYVLIFWMAVAVFVGVEGFLIYAIVRYRRRREDELPSQVHGNTRLEVAWTIIPSIVLLIIAVPTIGTIFASDAVPPGATQYVKVIGHQWWWEFQYPDLGVVTANELHLPVNETVRFEMESKDVIHSFWFPRMGGKMDVVPTRKNHMWFTPKETGEFYGQCVEFCGTQHANMRMRLYVHTPQEFQAWVQQQRAPAAVPTSGLAAQGAEAFQNPVNFCVACHTVRGTSAQGTIGPDLTHIGSRKTLASGMLDNTPEEMARWIRDPQGVKINNKMVLPRPPSDQDLAAIVAYLQTLK
jgi:cytochrome c oxidase subunit 2